jgi:hypothetical protein
VKKEPPTKIIADKEGKEFPKVNHIFGNCSVYLDFNNSKKKFRKGNSKHGHSTDKDSSNAPFRNRSLRNGRKRDSIIETKFQHILDIYLGEKQQIALKRKYEK